MKISLFRSHGFRRLLPVAALSLLPALASGLAAQPALTIYNQDFAVVR